MIEINGGEFVLVPGGDYSHYIFKDVTFRNPNFSGYKLDHAKFYECHFYINGIEDTPILEESDDIFNFFPDYRIERDRISYFYEDKGYHIRRLILGERFVQLSTDKDLLVYKIGITDHERYCMIKLRVRGSTERILIKGGKCRAAAADVLDIYDINDARVHYKRASSLFYAFDYVVGETVAANTFDPRPWIECSNGIHFFLTAKEAIFYLIEE